MNKYARVWEKAEQAFAVVSHGEAEREGRRVLRQLSRNGVFLAPDKGAHFMLAGSKRVSRNMKVSAVVVAEFRKREWLTPRGTTPETFALGDKGAMWLAGSGAQDDAFARQHRLLTKRLVKTDAGEEMVDFNELESPLSRLRFRKHITPVQYEAGERLRQDFTLAGMMPRLCADLTAPICDGARGAKSEPMTEKIIAARQRFRLAMASVGPGLSDLLFDVCCHLKGLERVEAGNEWPARSAKVVLQIALDRLAAHYRIGSVIHRGKMRVWRAEDARPSL